MPLSDSVMKLYHNSFNPKFAVISAYFNGVIAAGINSGGTDLEMIAAGGAGAAASFLSTGFTARLVQHFSPIDNRFVSYFFGSLAPATATFVISYAAHRINGTEELLASCITPVALSYTTSYVTNFITRRGHMLPGNYPSEK